MLGVAAVLAAIATTASADPTDFVTRPLVLDRGQIEATLVTEINLQKGEYGTPLSLAPDAWLGITERWTVGVIHSDPSVDRIDAGASFCVRQLASRCDRTYRGGGIDVRWSWVQGELAIAPRARFVVRDVDPVKPAITAGALIRWTHGRYAISGDPYLRFGLANTDQGNRPAIALPIYLALQPTCRWLLAVHTGWGGDFAVITDGWHIPFGLIVRARASAQVDVQVEAGFTSLVGPLNNIKQRAALISISWRS